MSGTERDIDRLLGALPDVTGETLRVQTLVTLVDAAHSALVDLGPTAALPAISAALLKVMDCTTAVISLVDHSERVLVSVAGIDLGGVQTRVEARRALATHPTLERVVGELVPLFVGGSESAAFSGEAGAVRRPGGTAADAALVAGAPSEALALPLVLRGIGIGIIELLAGEKEHRFSVAELKLAQGVCESVAAASEALAAGATPGETPAAASGATPAASAADQPPPVANGGGEISRQLEELARRLAEGVGVSHADILVRQTPIGALRVVAHYREGGESGPASARVHEYGLGETGVRGTAIAERVVTFARDDDPDVSAEERAEMAARGERSVMYVPIVSHDTVVGLLAAVETRLSRRFTPAEEAFAQQLAWEAAVAVNSARIVEQMSSQNREMSMLLETGAAIAASVDLRETLSTIGRLLVETLGAAWCNIYDHHAASAELEVIAYFQIAGIKEDPAWIGTRHTAESWADGLLCVSERAPRTVYYDWSKLTPEEFAFMEPWGEKALMIVPIVYGDEVLGVLDVAESRYPRRFSSDEMHLAQAIANQAAVAIRNARLYADATALYEEAQDRNAELQTMLGAAEALSSTVDFDLVLAAVCWRIKETLAATCVEVYEYDAAAAQLVYRDHAADEGFWTDDPEWDGVYDITGNALVERCVGDRETVVVNVDDLDASDEYRADMVRYGESSEVWIPMVYKGEVLGVLTIVETTPDRRFDEDAIRLAAAIANQGAVAIGNARAFRDLERERARLQRVNRRLSAFAELSGRVRGLVGEAELLDLTGEVMSEALGFAQWVAYLYDPATAQFDVRAAVGAYDVTLDRESEGTSIPARVIVGLVDESTPISQSFFVDHHRHTWTEEENLYLPGYVEGDRGEGEWTSDDTLLVPMMGQSGTLIGYLEAYDPVDRQLPDEETVRLLEIFAARAAGAIELARAHAELEQQSRTDGLTGLFNHRHFQERLQDEVARAVRTQRPLTVLMLDVDNFKEFNDTYGHPQGDRLLKALADLLTEQTRQRVDFVARYGGEEFVVLLPDTGLGGGELTAARLRGEFDDVALGGRTAEQVAEAIRSATEERALAGMAPSCDGCVTISIGVATFPQHGRTADQLVANADKALYLAKRLGKNRTCVYEG